MKRRLVTLLTLVILSATAAFAAQLAPGKKAAKATTGSVSGTVVSSSADSLTVKTNKGEMQFMLDSKTSKPANLAVGAQVKVQYRKEGDTSTATKISVSSKAPKAKSTK